MSTPDKKNPDLQGEGNYDATRRYRKGLEESIRKGNAEELAVSAEQALEGPEGEELRKAEEKAKNAETPGIEENEKEKQSPPPRKEDMH